MVLMIDRFCVRAIATQATVFLVHYLSRRRIYAQERLTGSLLILSGAGSSVFNVLLRGRFGVELQRISCHIDDPAVTVTPKHGWNLPVSYGGISLIRIRSLYSQSRKGPRQ